METYFHSSVYCGNGVVNMRSKFLRMGLKKKRVLSFISAIRMPHVPVLQPSECHMFLCCSHQNATCSCAAAIRMPHVPVLQPSECHMFLCCSHQNATCSCAAAIRMPHVPVLQPSVAEQRTAVAVWVRKDSPAMAKFKISQNGYEPTK